jgi:hypothetical protein
LAHKEAILLQRQGKRADWIQVFIQTDCHYLGWGHVKLTWVILKILLELQAQMGFRQDKPRLGSATWSPKLGGVVFTNSQSELHHALELEGTGDMSSVMMHSHIASGSSSTTVTSPSRKINFSAINLF